MDRKILIKDLAKEIQGQMELLSIFLGENGDWIADSYVKEKMAFVKKHNTVSLDIGNQRLCDRLTSELKATVSKWMAANK